MGAESNMPDISLLFQAEYIIDEIRLKYILVILFRVNKKHHPKIYVSEDAEHLLKILFH